MSCCCCALDAPAGEGAAGGAGEEAGASGADPVLPPAAGAGVRAIPKEPRLQAETERWGRGGEGQREGPRGGGGGAGASLPACAHPHLGTSPGASVCRVCSPCWICSSACMARGLVRTESDSGFCICRETRGGR